MLARMPSFASFLPAAPILALLLAPTPAASAQMRHPATASLLIFKEDQLISQGSAVAIAADGHFLTAAHLLRAGDRLQLQVPGGTGITVKMLAQDAASDLALLKAEGWRGGIAALALGGPAARAPVSIAGYWTEGLEPERSRGLFGPDLPRFQPDAAAPAHNAAGIVTAGDGQGFSFVADAGRGAYGAAVLNNCGELLGIARAAAGDDIARLWQPHRLAGNIQATGPLATTEWLRRQGVSPSLAAGPCDKAANPVAAANGGSPAAPATGDNAAATEQQRRKAEEKAAQEARRRREAEGKAAAEKAGREKAEQEAAASREAQEQAADLAGNLGRKLEEQQSELAGQERLLSTRTIALAGAGVALLICLGVALLLQRSRRRALRTARAAMASFPDCRLQGTAADGTPLAVIIPGKALRQATDGLLIGRNPEQAQIVIADQTVSRVHARLRLRGDVPVIADAGSATGTAVDGTLLAPSEEMVLPDRALLTLGGARLQFSITGGEA